MPRKPSSKPPKAGPLQVRMDPDVLERVRSLAGDEGAAGWVRQAIAERLARLDEQAQTSPPQPQQQATPAPGVDLILAHLNTAADAAASRDVAMARALAGLRADAAESLKMLRLMTGAVAAMARPLGLTEREIDRLADALANKSQQPK